MITAIKDVTKNGGKELISSSICGGEKYFPSPFEGEE